MTVSATNPMADLYRRLKSVGLTKRKVRDFILPDWWDDQIAVNPAAFAEGISYISRHLGLDLASLRDPSGALRFRDTGVCKFKKSKGTSEDQLQLTRSLATRVAGLVNAATMEPCCPLPKTAAQMRSEILGQGQPWVSLSNLLDYCWSLGVPVVHLSSFLTTRQPDGMAVKVRGRPVVVLCKKVKASAWLLFILAHELGHIALGHIPDNGVLIDENVDTNENDDEEAAANAFAIELLAGAKEAKFRAGGRWPNAEMLSQRARELGRELQIDPGHIILNYAHTMGKEFFPVANAAIGKLGGPDAIGIVRRKLAQHLDWSRLPEDSSEFLMRVSQAENTSDLPLGQ
ncbi:hypothetical protein OJF2_13890 [Aquisphaera giovannonii]|uniref:IrrE N-terminal-like domain-containing protein n=1 Tax=Aquisphaera giovannonii TaxID=406548 RepID=A0A5B9VXZ9_9BACT|nr:ImmA/IrrE family metallo-endopeptidase [Aquisphaera giovannonii]QEH32904.1 hypothetical protein OJF2_13890 [Aquisphaera giovannonii]